MRDLWDEGEEEKDDDLKRLLPCPFCGAGTTEITENGKVWTGQKYSEPTSVSVRHWCERIDGQPNRMLERIGRDTESAIAAWNMRSNAEVKGAPTTDATTGDKP